MASTERVTHRRNRENLSSFSATTVVTDPRTAIYHPKMVADIANTASQGHMTVPLIEFFRDFTYRSTLSDITTLKEQGINKAVVVGFVTGPGNDGNYTMAERAFWFLTNLNSLLHPARPWVKEENICLTIPHFEARSDRDANPGEAALAEIIVNAIAGAERKPKYMVTLDDHSHRLDKYIKRGGIKHVAVTANQLLAEALIDTLIDKGYATYNMVMASPDFGGAGRADDFAQKLSKLLEVDINTIDLAIVDKQRDQQALNASKTAGFIREVDVKDRTVIIRDDVADTLGTALNAATEFRKKGAKRIILVETHAVHSTDKRGVTAKEKIEKALNDGCIDAYFITDSRPLTWENENPNIHVVPVGELLGKISASLLQKGYFSTLYKFRDHIFQPKHPMATVKEITRRRNGKEHKDEVRIYEREITPAS